MMSSNYIPNKKRKANDDRATTADSAHVVNTGQNNDGGGFLSSWFGYYFTGRGDDGASLGPPSNEQSIQQTLSQMNKTMMRMEEKLATVGSTMSSLESRCEQLERKCSSLETKFEASSQSTKDHMDKTLSYHEMLIKNQKWVYSAPVYSRGELELAGFNHLEADYIYQNSQKLKSITETMRRGDFSHESSNGGKGIILRIADDHGLFDDAVPPRVSDELNPHWIEFAVAFKLFKTAFDVLPDDHGTTLAFNGITLNLDMTEMLVGAMINMPFKTFSFDENTSHFHGGMGTIGRMMGNNEYLQKLEMDGVQIDRYDISTLCSAIQHHPSLVQVCMVNCFSDDRLGNEMLRTLLRTDDLKLKVLRMNRCNLMQFRAGNDVCTLLADFLATNPRLRKLDLDENYLDDSDAVLIANALRSNTTLRHLLIMCNLVGEVGEEALRAAVRDESSLNSVADSNNWCVICTNDAACEGVNRSDSRKINRARKIYALLSSRNETMSNVQHFGDIDVKLLPTILEAVQKYSNMSHIFSNTARRSYFNVTDFNVKALSIVYEVMRRWDKVSPLYKK